MANMASSNNLVTVCEGSGLPEYGVPPEDSGVFGLLLCLTGK